MCISMAAAFRVRGFEEADLAPAAAVLFDAFLEINRAANAAAVKIDFATVDVAYAAVRARFEDESSEGLVAVEEAGNKIIGLGFIVFGGEVNSLALIAVSPKAADRGIGKRITALLLEKSNKSAADSVRLVQGAPNTKSFSLYVKLGFRPVEFFNNFVGSVSRKQAAAAARSVGISITDYVVRKMELTDVHACSELFKKTLGYDREAQIREKVLSLGSDVRVILKDDTVVGYTTGFSRSGYTIATSEESAIALFSNAADLHLYIIGQLYPRLLRWAFEARLSLIRHGSFMVLGSYQRPRDKMVWSLCGIN